MDEHKIYSIALKSLHVAHDLHSEVGSDITLTLVRAAAVALCEALATMGSTISDEWSDDMAMEIGSAWGWVVDAWHATYPDPDMQPSPYSN